MEQVTQTLAWNWNRTWGASHQQAIVMGKGVDVVHLNIEPKMGRFLKSIVVVAVVMVTLGSVYCAANQSGESTWVDWQLVIGVAGLKSTDWATVWFPVPPSYELQKVVSSNFNPASGTVLLDTSYGNRMASWRTQAHSISHFVQELEVSLLRRQWKIDPERVGEYSGAEPGVERYLDPAEHIQSDHNEIVAAARNIVGSETNPYLAAKKILAFVWSYGIRGSEPSGDALSVLRTRKGQCGAYAFLFVALSRAAGIPARPVSGIAYLKSGRSTSVQGTGGGVNGYHIWCEIYLQNYGWVPVDATRNSIGSLDGDRLVLSVGSDIPLGREGVSVPWFHIPIASLDEWPSDDYTQIGSLFCLHVSEGHKSVFTGQSCLEQLAAGQSLGRSNQVVPSERLVAERSIIVDGEVRGDWAGIEPIWIDTDWRRQPIEGADIRALYVTVSDGLLYCRLDLVDGRPKHRNILYSVYVRPPEWPNGPQYALQYCDGRATFYDPNGPSRSITASVGAIVEMAVPLEWLGNLSQAKISGETRPAGDSWDNRYDDTPRVAIVLP